MPTLIEKSTGREYRTSNQTEVVRLTMSGRYEVKGQVFHPAEHSVKDVVEYIKNHPEERDRIIAEELGGQARTTIVGDEGSENS